MTERTDLAKDLANEAAQIAVHYFKGEFSVETKKDQSPVTVADREIENLLARAVEERFPEDGFLGEEYGDRPGSSGYRWIVDPIDGTRNFVRRIPMFATLIGIEKDGEVIAGVANSPLMNEYYVAEKGAGVFLNDESIQVSVIDSLEEAHLVYPSFRKLKDESYRAALFELAGQCDRSRGFGDYYGHVLVASGRSEIMMEPSVNPWDIAAIKILVEEAGGIFTDLNGERTIYGHGAVSSNPALHSLVIDSLNGAKP
ncbi:MAG: inositol monophosphatase family protein [Planctomycetota bacterium]|jgi:histidinol phosphatase-like enzyme (inositol monophosphatase family)|nr:inositol monophosphatase family protein [Planctomycetota bacterium]